MITLVPRPLRTVWEQDSNRVLTPATPVSALQLGSSAGGRVCERSDVLYSQRPPSCLAQPSAADSTATPAVDVTFRYACTFIVRVGWPLRRHARVRNQYISPPTHRLFFVPPLPAYHQRWTLPGTGCNCHALCL